jgi:hypothetical protein
MRFLPIEMYLVDRKNEITSPLLTIVPKEGQKYSRRPEKFFLSESERNVPALVPVYGLEMLQWFLEENPDRPWTSWLTPVSNNPYYH